VNVRSADDRVNAGRGQCVHDALAVFVPFSIVYLREPPKVDYLWAGLCLCGAAYFMFRGMNTV